MSLKSTAEIIAKMIADGKLPAWLLEDLGDKPAPQPPPLPVKPEIRA